jgi:hypothetical protein
MNKTESPLKHYPWLFLWYKGPQWAEFKYEHEYIGQWKKINFNQKSGQDLKTYRKLDLNWIVFSVGNKKNEIYLFNIGHKELFQINRYNLK